MAIVRIGRPIEAAPLCQSAAIDPIARMDIPDLKFVTAHLLERFPGRGRHSGKKPFPETAFSRKAAKLSDVAEPEILFRMSHDSQIPAVYLNTTNLIPGLHGMQYSRLLKPGE